MIDRAAVLSVFTDWKEGTSASEILLKGRVVPREGAHQRGRAGEGLGGRPSLSQGTRSPRHGGGLRGAAKQRVSRTAGHGIARHGTTRHGTARHGAQPQRRASGAPWREAGPRSVQTPRHGTAGLRPPPRHAVDSRRIPPLAWFSAPRSTLFLRRFALPGISVPKFLTVLKILQSPLNIEKYHCRISAAREL